MQERAQNEPINFDLLSWNDFFYALILTRTQAVTAPVAIVNFLQYEGWEWSRIAAAGTLVMSNCELIRAIVGSLRHELMRHKQTPIS
jgi:ABC-type spermidine/putrescine transport system permease subunit II